jgi:hypothetical protein
MSIPPPIQQEPSAEIGPSQSPSSHRLSRSCKKILSWRGLLIYLALLMVIIIIIGLLATAHTYYHEMRGFGWLKSKRERVEHTYLGDSILEPQICLPSRRLALENGSISPPHITGRSPANVPYYTCGDQQNSCEAYGHPVSDLILSIHSVTNIYFAWPGNLLSSSNDMSTNISYNVWSVLLQRHIIPPRMPYPEGTCEM